MKVSIMDLANSNCDQYDGIAYIYLVLGKEPTFTTAQQYVHATLEVAKKPFVANVYKIDHWCPIYKDVVHCSKVS